MRKSILLVAVLFAVAGLMGAFAYSSAMVSSSAEGAIVGTDEAFLALIPNEEFDPQFVTIGSDGKLAIDFTAGGTSGFQPGSTYTFNDLFYIKNNLDVAVNVGMRFSQVYVGQEWLPGLWRVDVDRNIDNNPTGVYNQSLLHGQSAGSEFTSGWFEDRYVTLQPGEEIPCSWLFSVGDQLGLEKALELQVHAERVTP